MSIFFPYSMFFLSFVPLWISILFIDVKSIICTKINLVTEWVTIGAILTGLLISIVVLNRQLQSTKAVKVPPQILKSVKEEKSITAEFLLSYILPLFAFDFTQWDQIFLFGIFFATFGYLSIRHNYFCINIILELKGYRVFSCILTNSDNYDTTHTIISKQRLNGYVGKPLSVKKLNNDFSFDLG